MRIDHGLLPGHVLQRTPTGASVTISGVTDGPCACPITATVRKGTKALPGLKAKPVGRAAEGRFRVVLKGLPTGGPYAVELTCGGERVVVREVYVGDLWLMAGQSNMEGIGNLCDAPQPHPLVRNFAMRRAWEIARDPLHYLPESPDPVHGGGIRIDPALIARSKRHAVKGVGVGVHFGKRMHVRSKVPQGLIATAHGGTSMAQWDPALKGQGGDSLYGSMSLSLQAVGQPIAGVLWYQGCSDVEPAQVAVYTAKMQALVAAVRRDLRQPRLPWIIVQIGRVIDIRPTFADWNAVQEQQRLLPKSIPACDVVPAVDLDLDDGIHVSAAAFATLAERMARVAARLVLGDKTEKPAIQPKAARYLDPSPPYQVGVEVSFANVVGGLRAEGIPRGLVLVGPDGQPQSNVYTTRLSGDRATIYLNGPCIPGSRLMYGCGVNPVCNIVDGRGMGLPVFGPMEIGGLTAHTAWFRRWRVTPVQPGEDIAKLPQPDPADPAAVERSFDTDYVNLHPEWLGKTGHAAFHGHIDASEAMDVVLRLGYDGPFRVWVDGREVFTDLGGINPMILDAYRVPLTLKPGRHAINVLMALNGGRAWGFLMRMSRAAGVLPTPWE